LQGTLSPFLEELRGFVERIEHQPDEKVLDHLSGCGDAVRSLSAHLEQRRHTILPDTPSCDGDAWPPPLGVAVLIYTTETLQELVEISAGKGSMKADHTIRAPVGPAQTFFPAGRIDGTSLKNAIKFMISVLLASVLWVLPTGNVQAAISAGIVANQAKQSASYKKLLFRLLGTLLGGAIGLAYVVSVPPGPAWLVGLSPAILLICSYVGLGDEDWSYVGLTAGLCFILCLGAAEEGLRAFGVATLRIHGVVAGGMTAAVVMKFLLPFNYLKSIGELGQKLLSLYARAIAVTEGVVTGGNVTDEEMRLLRMEMRNRSIECVALIGDATWDRLRLVRKREAMKAEAASIRSLYHHFFSIFALSRSLVPSVIGPETLEDLRQIFADMESFLRVQSLQQRDALKPSPPAELKEAKNAISATLDRMSPARKNPEPETKEENLFFLKLLLQCLGSIIQELEALWPRGRTITGYEHPAATPAAASMTGAKEPN
jgi:hypothetical protein